MSSEDAGGELPDLPDTSVIDAGQLDTGVPDSGRCDRAKPFGTPEAIAEIDPHVAGSLGIGGARLTADELTMYFFSTGTDAKNYRVFVSTRASRNDPFSVGVLVELGAPNDESDAQPSPSGDGSVLVFQRTAGGLSGDRSLYLADRAPNGTFTNVRPIAGLSSPTELERTPYVGSDGTIWLNYVPTLDAGAKRGIAQSIQFQPASTPPPASSISPHPMDRWTTNPSSRWTGSDSSSLPRGSLATTSTFGQRRERR